MSALLCPKCGDPLKWACNEQEGEAYCSALQSRVVSTEAGYRTALCDFVGKVRRVSPSEVVLVCRDAPVPSDGVDCPVCPARAGGLCRAPLGQVHWERVKAAFVLASDAEAAP